MDCEYCELCSRPFSRKSNLKRHLIQKHHIDVGSMSEKKEYICDTCNQSFGTKNELRSHVPTHNPMKSNRIRCSECTSSFRNYKTYRRHLIDDHKIQLEELTQSFDSMKSFYEWKEKIERQDCVSFVQNTSSTLNPAGKTTYFICHRSYQANLKKNRSRKLKGKGSVKLGYACPATMIVRESPCSIVVHYCLVHLHPCELGHLRLSKNDRSYIAGKLSLGISPKRILQDIRNSTTDIKQRLHLAERKDIHNIIRDFHISKKNFTNDTTSNDSVSTNHTKVAANHDTVASSKELDLPDRKEIQNVISDFHISKINFIDDDETSNVTVATSNANVATNDAINTSDDISNIKVFVESFDPDDLANNSDDPDNNPVLFLKLQGDIPPEEYESLISEEDFVLVICSSFERDIVQEFGSNIICIDSTHRLNTDDFLLHNILTVDEFGQGVPVAHCFSNKRDTSVYKVFFSEILKKVGVVSPKVLMTDIDPSIINSWSSIMGIPDKHLFSIWHILENWKKNLSKIKCEEKRTIVYKTLKALYSILNLNLFEHTLSNLCKNLINDVDTVEFGKYFISYYVPNKEKWAYAHHKYAGINTNNYMESLHKQIKYCILDGKSCRKLDDAINAILDMIQNKFFERAIKLEKNKCSGRMLKIQAAHEKMKSIDPDSIHSLSETEFVVSSIGDDHQYSVEKVDSLNNCSCKLRCNECNICVHQYRCSCPNSAIAFNICKHIHAVHFSKFVLNNAEDDDFDIPDCIDSVDVTNSDTLVIPVSADPTSKNIVTENIDIIKKLHICIGLYQKHKEAITEDLLCKLNSYLDRSISLIMEVEKSSFKIMRQKLNAEKQLRYDSATKMKLEKESQIEESSFAVESLLQEELLFDFPDTDIHTSNENDHSY